MRLAWHFVRADAAGALVLRDGRPVPPAGEWLVHDGPVAICASGLHASWRVFDALQFVTWDKAVACLVQVDDVAEEQADKLVCRRRRVVASVPCDDILRQFARNSAMEALRFWPEAPEIVRQYLETGDEDLRDAARDAAARDAYAAAAAAYAGAAAAAARDAARDAAARDAYAAAAAAYAGAAAAAARDAARDAAWAAARAAARDAAWAAEIAKFNADLEGMLLAEMPVDALEGLE